MDRDDEPQRTAAMSDEDPERTHLGERLEGADDTDADAAEEGVPSTYAGEEADATGRPRDEERLEAPVDRPRYQDEPARADRPGGGGAPLFADDEEADLRERPRSPGER
jgi:hypothetical protein